MATSQTDSKSTLIIQRTFDAPRETVFRAFTEAEELKKWFGPQGTNCTNAEVDLRPGGRYRLSIIKPDGETVHVGGVFQEIQPPKKIVYTWEWENGDSADMGETLVTLDFHNAEGSTELTLTHERFPNEEYRDHHGWGWNSCFDSMVEYLA